ncbi:MAG: ATP-binding protein [Firmicutes bacterium]|nr:ATP-binding protein [Bacillota bacterium]
MLRRKIESQIEEWIANGTDAMLITGARQTGKTFIIRELLKRNCDYIELNFLERPELIGLFESAKSTKDLLMRISVAAERELKPKETVVFLDEIQKFPDIVTRIKFLVEEGSYRYILSGSLLGVELKDIRSVPVGYMRVRNMYPLDIEEFFSAIGFGQSVLDQIKHCWNKKELVDEYLHEKMLDAFYLYLIVGGMPQAVQTYIDTNDIAKVSAVHGEITNAYKWDFAQYEENKKLMLTEIFDAIPGELEEKNKRFFINHVAGRKEFDRVKNDFLWLKNAGAVIPVYNVQELRKPLVVSEKRSLFKLFYSDVGLLTSRYPVEVKYQLLRRDASIKNGGLFENAVAQELHAKNISERYYNSKKQGELDFVIEMAGEIIPVEIKSGKDYKKHCALQNVMESDKNSVNRAIVFSNNNLEENDGILYAPIYMSMCLEEQSMTSTIYSIEI